MNEILTYLSPTSLAIAIERNLLSWMPVFGMIWEVKDDHPSGVKRSICPIAMPLFNSIMDADLEPEDVQPAVQTIIADAEVRHVPVLWWVGPSTRPFDLGKRLERNGFNLDNDSPGMAVDLASMKVDFAIAPGLTIQEVQGDGAMREWCLTMAKGYEVPAKKVNFMVESWQNFLRIVNQDTIQAYLAKLDGKPVATSLLQPGAGVAGIYAVSTIPEARRRGIGAQVTLHPLLRARAMGYKAGVLEASEMGVGVYRSLGFQEYCRISSYVYRPKKT